MPNDKMSNDTKCRTDKISKVKKVEWDKTPNRNNIEWDKMSNDKTSNGTKCRMGQNVEWQNVEWDKMSNGTKCQIVYNVKYWLCDIVTNFCNCSVLLIIIIFYNKSAEIYQAKSASTGYNWSRNGLQLNQDVLGGDFLHSKPEGQWEPDWQRGFCLQEE